MTEYKKISGDMNCPFCDKKYKSPKPYEKHLKICSKNIEGIKTEEIKTEEIKTEEIKTEEIKTEEKIDEFEEFEELFDKFLNETEEKIEEKIEEVEEPQTVFGKIKKSLFSRKPEDEREKKNKSPNVRESKNTAEFAFRCLNIIGRGVEQSPSINGLTDRLEENKSDYIDILKRSSKKHGLVIDSPELEFGILLATDIYKSYKPPNEEIEKIKNAEPTEIKKISKQENSIDAIFERAKLN